MILQLLVLLNNGLSSIVLLFS